MVEYAGVLVLTCTGVRLRSRIRMTAKKGDGPDHVILIGIIPAVLTGHLIRTPSDRELEWSLDKTWHARLPGERAKAWKI